MNARPNFCKRTPTPFRGLETALVTAQRSLTASNPKWRGYYYFNTTNRADLTGGVEHVYCALPDETFSNWKVNSNSLPAMLELAARGFRAIIFRIFKWKNDMRAEEHLALG